MRAFVPVIILAFTTFVVNMSTSVMTPFLPIYAESLGAELGIEIGLFTSMFLLTRIFVNYLSGSYSDRLGRKKLIVLGLIVATLASLCFALPIGWYAILLVRALQGVGSSMVWSPSTALVGDLIPAGRRGFAMGVYNSVSMAGWVLGPGLGGTIQWYSRNALAMPLDESFRAVFYGSVALLAASLIVVLIFIKDPEARAVEKVGTTGWGVDAGLRRSLIAMSLLVFAFALIVALVEPLLVYHVQKVYGLSADEVTSNMTMVYLISGFLIIGAQVVAGALADRMSKKLIIAASALSAQALVLLMPFAVTVSNIGILIVLWYGFFSIATPAYLALLQDLFPPRLRGTLTGAFLTIFDIGSLVGPIAGFLIYDNVSSALPFLMSGALGVLTVVSFLVYVKEPRGIARVAKGG